MSATLQDAILATRGGDKVGAQKVLADILKNDTENVHAWYLLALLVDSPQKKRAYLTRVLALDPSHEKANEQVQRLTDSAAAAPDEALFDSVITFESEEPIRARFEEPAMFDVDNDDSILPSWLNDEPGVVPGDVLVEEEPSEIFAADLPDWLNESAQSVIEEQPTLVTEKTPQELDDMLAEQPDSGTSDTVAEFLPPSVKTQTTAIVPVSKATSGSDSVEASLRRINMWLVILSFLALLTLIALAVVLIS